MRQLNVLYAGPVLAGRRSSLAALYGAHTHWLEGKKVRLSSGETILLNAMVPYTGSGFFTSLQEATRADHARIREIALAVVAFLPTINGVVFVADSREDRQDANLESLERVLRDLSDAGLDVERLPFVFQCNKRDLDDVMPFAQMVASLSTPRCAHVQSVADAGYGVTQALDSLVVLLDRDASKTRAPASRLELVGAGVGQAPSSPHRLFEELTPQPTGDDEIRSVLRSSTQAQARSHAWSDC